jgi:hypothetical protein
MACSLPALVCYDAYAPDIYAHARERSDYIKIFRQIEIEATGQDTMTGVLANEELQMFQESLWRQKTLHPIFIDKYCPPAAGLADTMRVLSAVDGFVELMPEFSEHEKVVRLRASLQALIQ